MLEIDWDKEDDIDWETLEDESVRDTVGDEETVNETPSGVERDTLGEDELNAE